jgi:hypothetical protein
MFLVNFKSIFYYLLFLFHNFLLIIINMNIHLKIIFFHIYFKNYHHYVLIKLLLIKLFLINFKLIVASSLIYFYAYFQVIFIDNLLFIIIDLIFKYYNFIFYFISFSLKFIVRFLTKFIILIF